MHASSLISWRSAVIAISQELSTSSHPINHASTCKRAPNIGRLSTVLAAQQPVAVRQVRNRNVSTKVINKILTICHQSNQHILYIHLSSQAPPSAISSSSTSCSSSSSSSASSSSVSSSSSSSSY